MISSVKSMLAVEQPLCPVEPAAQIVGQEMDPADCLFFVGRPFDALL
jgi:hypothetical protein